MSAVSKADVLETYSDLYDVFEDNKAICKELDKIYDRLNTLPSAQPDIAEKLYLCKCYVTDEEGLQHEVIHTGDIRRVTGWEI